jgi:hypothetical protein
VKRVTRRHFLATALAGALGLMGWYTYEHDFETLITQVLRTRLYFLDLEEADMGKFADDFRSDTGTYGLRGRLLALAYPISHHANFLDVADAGEEQFEDRVVSRFLLSTDFFTNGADESRAVRYVAYYTACGNPFARFD